MSLQARQPAPNEAAARQADALVADIESKVAAERRQLLDAAALEAEAVRARARLKARRQMRRAVAELRATDRQRQQSQAAQLETARRQQATARARTLLAAAWPMLGEALAKRWRDPVSGAQWQRAQLVMAAARWPRSVATVHHPGAWKADAVSALRELLAGLDLDHMTVQADPALELGLVVESDGARLDSQPRALLADRARVEAALLAALLVTHDE